MGNRVQKVLINYLSFDLGDIVRRGFFFLSQGREEVRVYEIVGEREILYGLFKDKRHYYYALKRLDVPTDRIEIYEKDEIDRRLVAKKLAGLSDKIDLFSLREESRPYDIAIDVWGENLEMSEIPDTDDDPGFEKIRIGTFTYSPSKEDFILICEEIYTEFNSLINKGQHISPRYHPFFHDRINTYMERWLEDNRDKWFNDKVFCAHKYWRYSEETKNKILTIVGEED